MIISLNKLDDLSISTIVHNEIQFNTSVRKELSWLIVVLLIEFIGKVGIFLKPFHHLKVLINGIINDS